VKGVAGNLGIGLVQAAAEHVERTIRGAGAPSEILLGELEATLGRTVQAIRRELARTAPPLHAVEGTNESDPETTSAAIARLRGLIDANDGDAVDALPAVERAVAGNADRSELDALRDALNDFDFDGARSRLEEIAEHCVVGHA
jgi:hypothetical protein